MREANRQPAALLLDDDVTIPVVYVRPRVLGQRQRRTRGGVSTKGHPVHGLRGGGVLTG